MVGWARRVRAGSLDLLEGLAMIGVDLPDFLGNGGTIAALVG